MDILGSDEDAIIDEVELKLEKTKLYAFFQKVLSPREKIVLVMRYGLFNYDKMTQKEVGKKLKISRSYVSRIEKKALEKLKVELER